MPAEYEALVKKIKAKNRGHLTSGKGTKKNGKVNPFAVAHAIMNKKEGKGK